MNNIQSIKELFNKNIKTIKSFGVSELYIFGSVAKNQQVDNSDVDLIVVFDEGSDVGLIKFSQLRKYLSHLLNTKVDLATKQALHPKLRTQILEEAIRAA